MDPRIRTNNLSSHKCALKPLNLMVTSFLLLIFNDLNKYLLPEIKVNPLKIKYIYFPRYAHLENAQYLIA